MKNQKGFSLIELLVVVIIIGIIAAIAIPSLLSSRRSANEATAIANLRTVHTANATYAATQAGNGFFAPDLAGLSAAPGLLDASWTGAPVKNTYTFTYTINPSTNPTAYCLVATTTDGGARQFSIASGGTIYATTPGTTATCTFVSGVATQNGTVLGS